MAATEGRAAEALELGTTSEGQSREVLEQLTAFDEVISKLSSSDIARGALGFIRDRLGVFRLSVALLGERGLDFYVLDSRGPAVPVQQSWFPLEDTILSRVFTSCEPLYRPDIASEPKLWPRDEEILKAGVRSSFLLPLVSSGACFGSLNLAADRIDGFSERERRLLLLYSPRLAMALQNARLFEELRASEERYRDIFHTVPIAIWEEDCSAVLAAAARLRQQGVDDLRTYADEHPEILAELGSQIRVLDVNDTARAIYGVTTPSELSGGIAPFLLPESYPALREGMLALAEGQDYFECETANRTLRGERLDVLMRVNLQHGSGEPRKMLVSMLDLTRRKAVERALQRRIAFDELVTVLSTSFINLPTGEIEDGIRSGLEAIGRFSEVDRSYVFLFSAELDRVERVFSWCAEGIDSDLCGWVGAREDLPWFTESVRRRESLLIPSVAELPVEAAREREFLAARSVKSLAMCPLVDRGEPIGLLGLDTLRSEQNWPADVMSLLKIVGQMFVNALERKRAEEALRLARDELEMRVLERTAALEAAKAALEKDIAARRRAEAEKTHLEGQLRQSRVLEAVGLLAGGVAHDFNNLLGSIIGCLYVAKLQVAEDSSVREELDRAQALCKRGGDLTRQLLTVARRRTGLVETVELSSILEDVQVLLGRTLPKNIEFTMRIGERIPHVRAERSLLTSALLNLGVNARDAMPHGGQLTITVGTRSRRGRRRWVAIEVSDTGMGISEAVQDRIFDPFFTTKGPGEGTGLGLSMVYAAVAECGGKISVRSAPGAGATFRLVIPAAPPPAGIRPPAGEGEPERHPLTAAEILLVEDEENVARLVLQILHTCGYSTHWVKTGLAGLEKVRDHRDRLGLVVLDLVLPELGGEEVYRLLRHLAPEVPILVITGREDLARSLAPASALLPKPFTAQEFLKAIAGVLTAKGWG